MASGEIILAAALAPVLSASMALAWAVALRTGRSGWIDAIWSFATGICGAVAALAPVGDQPVGTRQLIVAAMVLLWSLRLGSHIAARTAHGGDDPRYAELRVLWGGRYSRKLLGFLQVQAAAAFLLVLSVMSAARNPADAPGIGDWLGIAIFVVAVGGEALADAQLSRFRADPANKDKVCDHGLWRYSRHPNYFFEWMAWLAYVPIAANWSQGYHWGWIALAGPAFMYWLLVHVSGIPPLEEHMLRSRGSRFRAYQARVSAFWPWFPSAGATQEGRKAP